MISRGKTLISSHMTVQSHDQTLFTRQPVLSLMKDTWKCFYPLFCSVAGKCEVFSRGVFLLGFEIVISSIWINDEKQPKWGKLLDWVNHQLRTLNRCLDQVSHPTGRHRSRSGAERNGCTLVFVVSVFHSLNCNTGVSPFQWVSPVSFTSEFHWKPSKKEMASLTNSVILTGCVMYFFLFFFSWLIPIPWLPAKEREQWKGSGVVFLFFLSSSCHLAHRQNQPQLNCSSVFRLIYDSVLHSTSAPPGVNVRVPGFGQTYSVEYLDPGKRDVGECGRECGRSNVFEVARTNPVDPN